MKAVTETMVVITLTPKEANELLYQIEAIGVEIDTPLGHLESTLSDLDYTED